MGKGRKTDKKRCFFRIFSTKNLCFNRYYAILKLAQNFIIPCNGYEQVFRISYFHYTESFVPTIGDTMQGVSSVEGTLFYII